MPDGDLTRALLTTVEIMTGRFPIEDVTPSVSGGRYPAKAVVGELVPVAAVSYREGHNALGVNVVWRGPAGAKTVPHTDEDRVRDAASALRDDQRSLFARVSPALDLEELLWDNPVRQLVTTTRSYAVWVDRERALYSAWYEFFPRSEGAEIGPESTPIKHGTFATAAGSVIVGSATAMQFMNPPPRSAARSAAVVNPGTVAVNVPPVSWLNVPNG